MRHIARHRFASIPLVVAAAVVLVGCTVTETDVDVPPTAVAEAPGAAPAPQSSLDPGAERPGDLPSRVGRAHPLNDACTDVARYDIYKMDGGEWEWSLTGTRTDTGAADHANGAPNADLTAYVVAPGDSMIGIGARFCVDSVHLALINHRTSGELYAEETIRLFPDGAAAEYVVDPDA